MKNPASSPTQVLSHEAAMMILASPLLETRELRNKSNIAVV
jgi:hypothetical protein